MSTTAEFASQWRPIPTAVPTFYGEGEHQEITVGPRYGAVPPGVESLQLTATGSGEDGEFLAEAYVRLPRAEVRRLRDELSAWLDRTGS